MGRSPGDDLNPFAPPRARIGDRAAQADGPIDDQAERIRRLHLSHEASVKAVGVLGYLASGFCGFIVVIFPLMAPDFGRVNPISTSMRISVVAFYGALCAVAFALGYGLRLLQAWARWTTMILSMLALMYCLMVIVILLGFAIGPVPSGVVPLLIGLGLILAYFFYLMVAPKGAVVFSAEYQRVIAATPEIRTRTSPIVKVFLGFLVGLLVLAVVAAIVRTILR
jgi:hypothetical protein